MVYDIHHDEFIGFDIFHTDVKVFHGKIYGLKRFTKTT